VRILLTGGTGQLGRAITRLGRERHEIHAFGSRELDVSDYHFVHRAVNEHSPEVVVHAGAMTDVDGCELDVENAFRINGIGTQNLAAATFEAGIPIGCVSTNFVFDGTKVGPYLEFDSPNPISVYGASKLAGERAVATLNPRHFIVRTAMVFDETGRNFVNTMLRLAESHTRLTVVADQTGNPTYAADLALGILRLIDRPAYGIYHLTNSGSTSWHGWATKIFELCDIDIEVEPIPASEFRRAATPPANGVLANLAAAGLGVELPHWEDALACCLKQRSEIAG
jgi:dTDP-4-dehydrorhamnose reductase